MLKLEAIYGRKIKVIYSNKDSKTMTGKDTGRPTAEEAYENNIKSLMKEFGYTELPQYWN